MLMKISFIISRDSSLLDPDVSRSFVSLNFVYLSRDSLSLVCLTFSLSFFNSTYSHSLFFKDSL